MAHNFDSRPRRRGRARIGALRETLHRLLTSRKHRGAEEAEEVLEALRRLDDGTYGDCTDCGLAIPANRLRARPEATRCLLCQSLQEQQQVA